MKNKFILLFTALAVLCCACNKPEKKEEQSSRTLKWAIAKMDILPGHTRNTKAVDIVGDSIAVHTLCLYFSNLIEFVDWEDSILGKYSCSPVEDLVVRTENFSGEQGIIFQRDTINHVFSFSNDAVIGWGDSDWDPINRIYTGIEGTEYLGWLACGENVVFRAVYDTVLKRYISPCYDDENLLVVGPTNSYPNNPRVYDTLGYIPNSLMKANRAYLEQLLKEKRYQEMVDFFESGAYKVYTCTGEEYRELARQGLN